MAEPPEVWVPALTLALGDGADDASVRLSGGSAVWVEAQDGSTRILFSRATTAGAWSSPRPLSAPGARVDQPSVFFDGNTVVAWRVFDGARWQIQARVQLAGSQTWSRPTTFAQSSGDAVEPLALVSYYYDRTVRTDPQVAWRRWDGASWRLQIGYVDSGGGSNTAFDVTPRGDDVRDVRLLDRQGIVHVVWSRFDGSRWLAEAMDANEPEFTWQFGPPNGDALEPSFAGEWEVNRVTIWRTSVGGVTRVRATPCMPAAGCSRQAVYLSPAGLDTDALAGAVWTDRTYSDHVLVAWRQYDGSNWRVAVRTKAPNAGWSALAYLSPDGIDASAPSVAAGRFADVVPGSVVVAWVEEQGTGSIARAAVFGQETPPEATTLSAAGEAARAIGVSWNGVGAAWISGPADSTTLRLRGFDATGPYSEVSPLGGRGIQGAALVRWSAFDDWSRVTGYDVRRSNLRWNGQRWIGGQVMTNTTKTSETVGLRPGTTSCIGARAHDNLGHTGAWTYPNCVTRPVDDRSMKRSGPWKARTGTRYYEGTYLTTRRKGASLVLGRFPKAGDQSVLVAMGPGNGKVRVESRCRGKWLFDSTLNLRASKNRTMVNRYVNSRWRCPALRLTVISAAEPVRIDGVYVPPRTSPWR